MSILIVEKRLEEAFKALPAMLVDKNPPNGVKPYYAWGNEFHLVRQLILKKQGLYPLIYQTSNRETHNSNASEVTTNLSLVLAINNPIQEELNESRWAQSYDNVLFPLMNNIVTLFTKGGIFRWDGEFTATKIPNYGVDSRDKPASGSQDIEIWDAILFETEITITNDCLKQIKY